MPHSACRVHWWTGLIQRWFLLPHPVEERGAGQQVPGKCAATRSSRAFSDQWRTSSPSSQEGRLSFAAPKIEEDGDCAGRVIVSASLAWFLGTVATA